MLGQALAVTRLVREKCAGLFYLDVKEIHYAAARGDVETVIEELRNGADVNHRDRDFLADFESPDLSELFDDEDIPDEIKQLQANMASIDTGELGEFEETALICAAKDRRAGVRMLDVLLDHGADIDLMGGGAETCALGEALRNGPVEKAELLVSRGASLDYVTKGGTSAWLDAAYNHSGSRDAMIDFLLDHRAPNINHVSDYGEHPCIQLSAVGAFHLIAKLIEAGADKDALRWTDVMWEIAYGSHESLEHSIKGSDLEARDARNRTPWLLAAVVGCIDKATLLLDAGADLHSTNHVEQNALHHAATANRPDMIRWLAAQDLNVDSRSEFGGTPLMAAAERGASDAVQALLELGADPSAEDETKGRAITDASEIESVKLLTAAGEDINHIGGDGYHLLKSAAEQNEPGFIRALLDLGAKADTTSTGDTALHTALSNDHLEIAELLMTAGADINQQDADGWSALHYCRSRKAVSMIVDAGADLSLEDDVGNTAAESFVTFGRPDLSEFLQDYVKRKGA